MINSTYLDQIINKRILMDNEIRKLEHEPSGKLSASMLGLPVQWQILKALKIPAVEPDTYTLKKFARGNDTEDWLVKQLGKTVIDTQVKVEYKEAIGYLDILAKGKEFDLQEDLPIEVKSVTNAGFKWINKEKEAKRGHLLQACYYAIGLKRSYFSVAYIASDDYRTLHFIYKVKDYRHLVDEAITEFQKYWKAKQIPTFEAIEKWMTDPKYNMFPSYTNTNQAMLESLAKKHYDQN